MHRIAHLAAALPLLLASCNTDEHAPRTKLPWIDITTAPVLDDRPITGETVAYLDAGGLTVGQRLADLALGAVARGTPAASVACFPFVTFDLRQPEPAVSELGLRMADDAATALEQAGFGGRVLSPPELDAHLSMAGLAKERFSTLQEVVAARVGLDVDLALFGTIKAEHSVQREGRDLLSFDLVAIDLRSAAVVARQRFALASDVQANAPAFDLAQRDSLWLATGAEKGNRR